MMGEPGMVSISLDHDATRIAKSTNNDPGLKPLDANHGVE
jgi:hypothetical protein